MRRAWLVRLAVAAATTGLAVAACDAAYVIGIRGAWRSTIWEDELRVNPRHNRADPELGYVRKPRLSWSGQASKDTYFVNYRTDERGFRNPPGVRRADVVFIGDSYTEGAQVPEAETFARQFERATGLGVINLGLGGYGPQQELAVLRRYGLPCRPRLVVWQMCEGNDLGDARRYVAWLRDPDRNPKSRAQRYVEASLLLRPFARIAQPKSTRQTIRYTDGEAASLTVRGRYQPGQPAQLPAAYADTVRCLEAADRLCREHDARLVVLFVPIMARVMKPYLTFAGEQDAERTLPGGRTDTDDDFDSRMARLCKRIGCSFINLADPLRAAAERDNRGLFLRNDEHFDRAGHRVVAETLAEWLRAQRDFEMPGQQVRR